jgi:hypothetical protein
VYEAARLALRWQVQGQRPQLSTVQAKGEVSELEAAIARLEAEAAGSGGVDTGEQGMAAHDAVEEFQPQPSDPASKLEDRGAMAGNLGGPGDCEPGEAPARLNTCQQSQNTPIEPEDCHAPGTVEKMHPQPASAALAGLEAVARSLDSTSAVDRTTLRRPPSSEAMHSSPKRRMFPAPLREPIRSPGLRPPSNCRARG